MNIYLQINLLLVLSFAVFFVLSRSLGFFTRTPSQSVLKGAQIALLMAFAAPIAFSFVPARKLPQIDFVSRNPLAETRKTNSRRNLHWQQTPPMTTLQQAGNAQLGWRSFTSTENFLSFLGFLFFAGVLARTLILARSGFELRALLKKATSIRSFGLTKVVVSNAIDVPFSFRARFAYVAIPSSLICSRRDYAIALRHELQHHRNHDTLWALFLEALTIPFFWNPVVWLWKKEMNELQEFSCDEALLGRGKVSSRDYGSCLVRVAEAALGNRIRFAGTASMAASSKNPIYAKSFLRRRIEMLMDYEKYRARTRLGMWVGTATALLTAAFAFGSQQSFRGNEPKQLNPGLADFDPAIESIAQNALASAIQQHGAKAGFAIVADPNTGRILAVANVDVEHTHLESNWALSMLLEPASIAKPIVAASALDMGLTQPDEVLNCENGNFRSGSHVYHDWKPFNTLTTAQTIAKSSNICGMKLGMKLGPQGLVKSLATFGFGVGGTASEFPGARPGEFAQPSQLASEDFIAMFSTGYSGLGQGYAANPLEIVQAYSTFANGGKLLKPLFFNAPASQVSVIRRAISEKTSQEMKDMLHKAVLEGTGSMAQSKLYTTAGKTGSAYSPEAPDHDKTGGQEAIAGFIGFAPVKEPKIIVYTALIAPNDDKGRAHGNTHAAPIFRQITDEVLQHMNIAPDLVN